ncbi:MAG: cytoplasmic protein [Rhizobiaceae bacterium]|nr:cytoplasmic protein [Rhizobiaceae bacterium]
MQNELHQEVLQFLSVRQARNFDARQTAAVQILCGFDLSEAMSADAITRSRYELRLERMIERERLRGSSRHWSYDLNRHIALKQALNRLRLIREWRK